MTSRVVPSPLSSFTSRIVPTPGPLALTIRFSFKNFWANPRRTMRRSGTPSPEMELIGTTPTFLVKSLIRSYRSELNPYL